MKQLMLGIFGAALLSGCISYYEHGSGANLTVCNFSSDHLHIYINDEYVGYWLIDGEHGIRLDPGTYTIQTDDEDNGNGSWNHVEHITLERGDDEMIILN